MSRPDACQYFSLTPRLLLLDPGQGLCSTSPLLFPESPYYPCARACCVFFSLLREALCIFSFLMHRSYLNLQAHHYSFWFSFLFSRQLMQVAHISKLHWEEKCSNSCNCSCSKIRVAIIHWSFKPQSFLEATELLHFLALSSLPFCSSLHLSPTDVLQICRTCSGAGGLNELYSFHRQKRYEVKAPWEEIGRGDKK